MSNKITIISEPKIVWKLNDVMVDTHFVSEDRQLFECNGKSFIYEVDKQVLHRLDSDKYLKLLLKLVNFESVIIENVDCIKSREI